MPAESGLTGVVPLVHVIRGEAIESVHFGALALADATGGLQHTAGDARAVCFLRSSAKPLQILPVIASGAADHFRFTPPEVAVAIASHTAQDFHVEAVRSILGKAGLSEELLMCGVHEITHKETARRMREEGRRPTPIHCNCSGKHAAMMSLAVFRGHAPEGYFRPEHPVQAEILSAVSEATGVPAHEIRIAVDNCTVPTFGLPLAGVATAYARIMEPSGFGNPIRYAAHRTVEAMMAHPEMVGGDGVIDTDLMRAAETDLIAKRGAEGFYGIGYRRDGKGYGIAFKIADGDMGRARNCVVLALARQLSLVSRESLDALQADHMPQILNNRGGKVGRIEPAFDLG